VTAANINPAFKPFGCCAYRHLHFSLTGADHNITTNVPGRWRMVLWNAQ